MKERRVRQLSSLHRRLFRLSGGRVGKRLVNNDMLLLTTVGRTTGMPHTVPLLYLAHGEDLIVIASYGGRPQHPSWYLNLVAEPRCQVQTRNSRFEAIARTAQPHQREAIWPLVEAAYHGYREYQSRTDRVIPVVLLSSA